ncbi:MAG: hypothetical protein ACRYF3_05750 [Janthinobacterium lividum]
MQTLAIPIKETAYVPESRSHPIARCSRQEEQVYPVDTVLAGRI